MTAQETFGANFFETTLTAEMAPTDLTANVVSTSGLTVPCYVVIEPDVAARREVILFDSSLTGTTLVAGNINKRYLTGSAAGSGITHPINSVVRYSAVMQLFTDINDRVDGVSTSLASKVDLSLLTSQGDLPYATGTSVWARLAKGTARQALIMNAGATAPSWGDSLASLLTAQGDLPYASAANTPARLAKGTAAQVLRMNPGATAPEWATPATATSSLTLLGATVTMTLANTYYDGASVSLAAGTWLLVAVCTINDPTSTGGNTTAKLWDGTTVLVSTAAQATAGGVQCMTLAAVVSPVGTTTYKVSAASTQTGHTIVAAAPNNGAGNNANSITAVKLV